MPSSLLLVIRASFNLMFCRVLLDIFDLIQRLDLLKGNPMLAEFDEIHLIADCIWNFQREASEVGSAQAFAWMFSAMLHILSYGFGVFSPAYCTSRSIYSSLSPLFDNHWLAFTITKTFRRPTSPSIMSGRCGQTKILLKGYASQSSHFKNSCRTVSIQQRAYIPPRKATPGEAFPGDSSNGQGRFPRHRGPRRARRRCPSSAT